MPCRQSMLLLASLPPLLPRKPPPRTRQCKCDNVKRDVQNHDRQVEISNADRDRACQLTFKADPSGALFKLDVDKLHGTDAG